MTTYVEEDRGFVTPCWIWQLRTDRNGYGITRHQDASTTAHRAVYLEIVGPIPKGLELDHLCRVRCCVNPNHVEPVTHAENMRRARFIKTHCVNGHAYDDANSALTSDGKRRCRACLREQRGSVLPPAAERTHCREGHEYDAENTIYSRKGHRDCRKCRDRRVARRSPRTTDAPPRSPEVRARMSEAAKLRWARERGQAA